MLESAGIEIGIVTSIVGLRGYRVRLRGEANHAGTTPMRAAARRARGRRAHRAGAARRGSAREAVTANVGKISVEPGGSNVVPGLADFTIDVRSTTPTGSPSSSRSSRRRSRESRPRRGSSSRSTQTFALEPLELDPTLVDAVERAAAVEGASLLRLPSGAGHDAMVVGRHVPAAMLFVPSRGGISHSPDEYSSAGARRARRARARLRPSGDPRNRSKIHARRRRRHRWHVHGLHALRHGVRRRPRAQGAVDAGGARAGDGERAGGALRRSRPGDDGRHRRLPRHDRRDERGAPAPGRGGGDDHDARLPGHRPHRPASATAPLLGRAGHPVAGAAVRAARATARS